MLDGMLACCVVMCYMRERGNDGDMEGHVMGWDVIGEGILG
jgi:hypothetical protein